MIMKCCGSSKHKCDIHGPSVLILSDGRRPLDTPENLKEFEGLITGGSATCSVCGLASCDDIRLMF